MGQVEVKYGSYNFPGGPTPDVGWSYEFNSTSAGRNIGATLNISIEGITSSGAGITGIQQAFSKDYQTFTIKSPCGDAEVFPNDDNLAYDIRNGIRVNSVTIDNSQDEYWRNYISYKIDLVVPLNSGQKYLDEGGQSSMLKDIYISSLSDTMNVSVDDKADYLEDRNSAMYPSGGPLSTRYLTIARTVSAAGKVLQSKSAIQSAVDAVKKVNEHTSFEDRINKDFAGLVFFDKVTSQNYNSVEGTYSVTDTVKAFSGNPSKSYTHEYNISNNIDNQLNRTVSINGTIKGYDRLGSATTDVIFDDGDGTTVKEPQYGTVANTAYAAAKQGFTDEIGLIKDRVLSSAFYPSGKYIDRTDASQVMFPGFKLDQTNSTSNPKMQRLKFLNPVPVTFTATHDKNEGTVSYTCSYDNRPVNHISDTITENFSVQDSYSNREYYPQNIMYRGAIMQTLGMSTVPSRTVTYTAKFKVGAPPKDAIDTNKQLSDLDTDAVSIAIDQFDPKDMIIGFTNSWVTNDSSTTNFLDGSFTRTKTWNYAH